MNRSRHLGKDELKKSYGEFTACNAPFNNMYFTVRGEVSPCWKLPGFCDIWTPERSIMDIWKGEHFEKYRIALKKNEFIHRCRECKKEIDDGVWPLAKAYDDYPVREYPSMMELELSNQCNLECTMCSGWLSSGIRKNRENLPPLPMAYTDEFRKQLHEFIPHLVELRFNGGEPFSQKIVLDICNDVAEINPLLKINIATNGTVYNKRVKHILETNNIHLNISIDSLKKERYESIRINSDFDLLMKNFKIFNQYHRERGRHISVMVNPMNNNWDEMIDFVDFCDNTDTILWYNTILYPKHLTIKDLPTEEIEMIYRELSEKLIERQSFFRDNDNNRKVGNFQKATHLVNHQILNWILDSHIR